MIDDFSRNRRNKNPLIQNCIIQIQKCVLESKRPPLRTGWKSCVRFIRVNTSLEVQNDARQVSHNHHLLVIGFSVTVAPFVLVILSKTLFC